MGNYTMFWMFENPRRVRQARNFTKNVPKIVDLKSSSEQIFSENCRWVPLIDLFSRLLGVLRMLEGLELNNQSISRRDAESEGLLLTK